MKPPHTPDDPYAKGQQQMKTRVLMLLDSLKAPKRLCKAVQELRLHNPVNKPPHAFEGRDPE